MDWKRFDRVRRDVGPVHLDLVESYAGGRISRRDFCVRGTMLGLTAPFIGTVIAAIGRDEDPSRAPITRRDPGASERGTAGRDCQSRLPDARRGARPGARCRTSATYGLIAQCFEFLCTLGEDGELAPGLAETWEPNEDGTVWTFNFARASRGRPTGRPSRPSTSRRRWTAWSTPATPRSQGVIAAGAVDASDPNVAVFTLEAANGNFPYLVSVFNAQDAITPAQLRGRHHARRVAQWHGPVEAH